MSFPRRVPYQASTTTMAAPATTIRKAHRLHLLCTLVGTAGGSRPSGIGLWHHGQPSLPCTTSPGMCFCPAFLVLPKPHVQHASAVHALFFTPSAAPPLPFCNHNKHCLHGHQWRTLQTTSATSAAWTAFLLKPAPTLWCSGRWQASWHQPLALWPALPPLCLVLPWLH
jgi:hypothetical protein